ncbi:CheR family methyltransferase [Chromobacterium haemolyticum]|uniref:CheR family methyltransferase n=1 Tax=Chromobacterium haemolyticum TaxID=394935 RepID=UPI0009D9E814|nr:CheR family methyltransferase [Chromobacterium haemolyticum]OQS31246.1 chemotaxis protein CheR [Chromobacterium haemolyticum]
MRDDLSNGLLSKEFGYRVSDFRRVAKHIYERAGIVMADSKQSLVYGRLSKRLRTLGFKNFSEYLDFLESGKGKDEWQAFINALTTNLTYFYREDYHFHILKKQVAEHGTSFKIWCAACSTGEEAYSLAMTVREVLGPQADSVKILASDIDTKAIAFAQHGIYLEKQTENLPVHLKKEYLLKGMGGHSGYAQVRSCIKNMVTFRRVNLLDDVDVVGEKFDAIFCRNVLIYFDAETQRKVLKKLRGYIKRGGCLYIGHSENVRELTALFARSDRSVYKAL